MVALEMAAADPDQADDISGTEDVSEVAPPGIQPADIRPVEVQTAERPSAEPEIVARAPEPVAAPGEFTQQLDAKEMAQMSRKAGAAAAEEDSEVELPAVMVQTNALPDVYPGDDPKR